MKDTVYWNRLRYLINHGLASSEDEIDWTQVGDDHYEEALKEIAVLITERRDIGSYSRVAHGSLEDAVAIARAALAHGGDGQQEPGLPESGRHKD